MNMKIPLSIAFLLILFSWAQAADMTAKEYADAIYADWSKPQRMGDDTLWRLCTSSGQLVPKALALDVIDQMMDRALSANPRQETVIGRLLDILGGFQGVAFPERLDQNIYIAGKDKNSLARRDVMEVLAVLHRDKDQNYIIEALNDPYDQVRRYAVEALSGRSSAKVILQKFVRDHEGDPAYKASVPLAKLRLRAAK